MAKATTTRDSIKFDPKATYVLGELKRGADTRFPETAWRCQPVDVPGNFFTRAGCRTVETYFQKNPNNLPSGRTYFIYERLPDGSLEFKKSGSFAVKGGSTAPGMMPGLADGTERPFPDAFYAGQRTPQENAGSDHRIVTAMQGLADTTALQMRDFMEMHQQTVGQMLAQNNAVLEKYQSLADQYAESRAAAEVSKAHAQHERNLVEFRKQVETECADYYKEMEKQRPSGLSDPMLIGAIAQAIPAVIQGVKELMKSSDTPAETPPAAPLMPDGTGAGASPSNMIMMPQPPQKAASNGFAPTQEF